MAVAIPRGHRSTEAQETKSSLLGQLETLSRAMRPRKTWFTVLTDAQQQEVLDLAAACADGRVVATHKQVAEVLVRNGIKITSGQWYHFYRRFVEQRGV